jgi:hypothetical protein
MISSDVQLVPGNFSDRAYASSRGAEKDDEEGHAGATAFYLATPPTSRSDTLTY